MNCEAEDVHLGESSIAWSGANYDYICRVAQGTDSMSAKEMDNASSVERGYWMAFNLCCIQPSDIFQDELGTMSLIQDGLKMREDVLPKFHRQWQMLFLLKENIE